VAETPDSLKERIAREMREALKGGEKVRLATLRLLSAGVKNREVELRRELSDDEVRQVATREVRRRTEAMEAYEKGGREDRAAREREERDILQAYLPAQLSDDEVAALIEEALAATGASAPNEMGKVMGFVMARAKGKVDGSKVQAQVRERLSGAS
jgi:uncharacterized protein YqeY